MMRQVFGVVTALLLAGAIAQAWGTGLQVHRPTQGQSGQRSQPRTPWWQGETKATLGLSDAQSADVDRLFRERLVRLRELKKSLDALEADLDRLIREGQVSEATIAAQIDRVIAVRSEIDKGRMLMLYRMRAVLTPEQRTKLRALQEKERRDNPKRDR
jgi:Spy/CpxP family protein refolding chaperone